MEITKHEENGRTVLAVRGWLDTPSSAELEPIIVPSIEQLQKYDEAVTKTCGGCTKQVADCPYGRDPELVALTFNGGHCPDNSRG